MTRNQTQLFTSATLIAEPRIRTARAMQAELARDMLIQASKYLVAMLHFASVRGKDAEKCSDMMAAKLLNSSDVS